MYVKITNNGSHKVISTKAYNIVKRKRKKLGEGGMEENEMLSTFVKKTPISTDCKVCDIYHFFKYKIRPRLLKSYPINGLIRVFNKMPYINHILL